MGLRLSRHLGTPRTILPGQYVVAEPAVFLCCPACGGLDDVSVSQTPTRTGLVPGKWVCKTATCSFSDWLSLGDWEPTERKQ